MLAADVVGHSSQPVVTDVALWFVGRPTSLNARLTGRVVPLFPLVYRSSSTYPASLARFTRFFASPPFSPFFSFSLFYCAVYRFSFFFRYYSHIDVTHLTPIIERNPFFFPPIFSNPVHPPLISLVIPSSPPSPDQSSCLLSTACRLSTRLSALLWFPSANTVNSYWPVCRHVITLN